jgi:hypothetical protein
MILEQPRHAVRELEQVEKTASEAIACRCDIYGALFGTHLVLTRA